MAIPVGNVSVKAKTNEKMDDVGAGVGIVVHSIALLA
jgi:2C-methyl-D-erythritol 2,4-cyclodiphosphate synthase